MKRTNKLEQYLDEPSFDLNKSKVVNGPLFERIQQENQRKQALGASYCEKCSTVLTLDSICVFCRLQ